MIIRVVLCGFLIYFGCAQMKPLSGGEKDTIPPKIIQTTPENLAIGVNNKDFFFVFDEIIDASKLKENLIISPFYAGGFKSEIKKNTLLLSFDSVFNKETTYIINFADGISDITEGNPSIYSKFVFSTGNKIDSSFVSGVVYDPTTNERVEGSVVGLYTEEDSFDLFNKKPIYFSLSDENGLFKIENIKKDNYTIYAFLDDNKNFTTEYKTEKFGFKENKITVNDSTKKIIIPVFEEDLTPISIQRTRQNGDVFDVVYNKKIYNYLVNNKDIKHSLYDNKTVSFYNNKEDTTLIIIKATDYIFKETTDTLLVFFNKNKKKTIKVKNDYSFSSSNVDDTVTYTINTNIPLLSYEYNSYLHIDTLTVPKTFFDDHSVNNNNQISGLLFIKIDSINSYLKKIKEKINNDSLIYENDSIYNKVKNYYNKINANKLTYKIKKGELITITNDTLKEIKQELRIRGKEYYGSLEGKINTKKINQNYVIELVSENMSSRLRNEFESPNFNFTNIAPGKYYLKAYNDKNQNNKWDYYSITTNKESEEIYYFNEIVEVRSNWSIEGLIFDVDLIVEKMFLKDTLSVN